MKANIEISVLDTDLVKNLIEVLELNWKDMPDDLKDIIKDIDETGLRDYTTEDYTKHIAAKNINANDVKLSHDGMIEKVNKYLKKIYYLDGTIEYADSFYIKHNDTLIYGW